MVNLLHQPCGFIIFVHTLNNCVYAADRSNLCGEKKIMRETRSVYLKDIAIEKFLV